ncbi:hypothetical protein GOHSU_38_00300 [Gordonia hirsuta DSM 44140 = NBRC 16056]|uniref:Uncharacterized protein n=1 Tax=Gordonia hirsuta DSM 44140 = NBRC 16056 TaxID=1121927 RepID=L7LCC5_9ACTN|nr:hypothetical protein [Gordonia hirsuta]GAC58391.1 hypothetical protein GOHSU_38_00300 [Gordonia hirsuta DSM 44140 = NBRC 16056]
MTVPITFRFVDVYDDEPHVQLETLMAPPPPIATPTELNEWADDHVFPHTGDGKAIDKDAAYFAEVTVCDSQPELVGVEFAWGC